MPEEKLTDRTLVCKRCQKEFTFRAGEQGFYEKKGLTDPKQCYACRQEHKHKGEYGSQVVSVNSRTGEVLCKQCAKPASKTVSFKRQKALCWACAEGPMYEGLVTPNEDRLFYNEWEERFNVERSGK